MTPIPQRTIKGDFPYEEIRRPDGDYFQSWQEAKDAGWDDDQIWSVTSAEGDDGSEWIIIGPPHHYCNHLGHLATLERHDNNTYYEECWRTAEEAAEAWQKTLEGATAKLRNLLHPTKRNNWLTSGDFLP